MDSGDRVQCAAMGMIACAGLTERRAPSLARVDAHRSCPCVESPQSGRGCEWGCVRRPETTWTFLFRPSCPFLKSSQVKSFLRCGTPVRHLMRAGSPRPGKGGSPRATQRRWLATVAVRDPAHSGRERSESASSDSSAKRVTISPQEVTNVITVEVSARSSEDISEGPESLTEKSRKNFLESAECSIENRSAANVLAAAKATAWGARLRASVLCLAFGFVVWMTLVVLGFTLFQDQADLLQYRTFILGSANLMYPFMLLGILPGDAWLTRAVVVAILSVNVSIVCLLIKPGERWERACDLHPVDELRRVSCAIFYWYRWTPVHVSVCSMLPLVVCLTLELWHRGIRTPCRWAWLRITSRRLLRLTWLILQVYHATGMCVLWIPTRKKCCTYPLADRGRAHSESARWDLALAAAPSPSRTSSSSPGRRLRTRPTHGRSWWAICTSAFRR